MIRVLAVLLPLTLPAQPPTLEQILERLARLETENQALRNEIGKLKAEVASLKQSSSPAPDTADLAERLDIQERRVDEQAQAKVEAAQKFPIKLTGQLVANLYRNGPHSGVNDHPTVAARAAVRRTAGLTFRQSIIGATYQGDRSVLGAQVRGSLFLDFWEGLAENTNFYPVRVRTASVELDWKSRSLSFVQEKPLFSLRDPNTFSYSGVSPLTSAGNLWRWQPQIRFEQRAGNGDTQVRAQVALMQTAEESHFDFAANGLTADRRRPGLEGRFEVAHRWGEDRRIEIAPSFHLSQTRVSGNKLRSDLFAVDWLAVPLPRIEFTGLFWSGQAVHHFGSLRQSFIRQGTALQPVEAKGGWSQVSLTLHERVSLNLFAGIHDDRNAGLAPAQVGANRAGAANLMFRIAPNVIAAIEAMQIRTQSADGRAAKLNRYDLSVAYQF